MLQRFFKPIVKKIHTRATIAELSRLTDHQLQDIGVSRHQIKKLIK